MVADCPYPFVTLPNDTIPCTTSYATAGGSAYIQYKIIWLVISSSCFLLSAIQNIRLWRIKGIHPKLFLTNLQYQEYGITFLSTLFVVIRGFDPHGWSGRNFQADQHLFDWSTIFVYALFTIVACSWLKIITGISGGQVIYVEYFQRSCIAVLTFFLFIVSLLKCYAHPTWIFVSMEIVFLMFLNITLINIAWVYGVRIQQQLLQFHASSKSHPHSPITSTRNIAQTTNTPPNTNRQTFRRKEVDTTHRKTISTILKLLTIMTILSSLAIAFLMITLLNALSTHYDYYNNPQDVPSFTFGSLFQQSIFPLAQEAVILTALYFFRRLPSRSNGGSRDLNENSTTTEQIKELENPHHINTPIQPIKGEMELRNVSVIHKLTPSLNPTRPPIPPLPIQPINGEMELRNVSADHKATPTPTPPGPRRCPPPLPPLPPPAPHRVSHMNIMTPTKLTPATQHESHIDIDMEEVEIAG